LAQVHELTESKHFWLMHAMSGRFYIPSVLTLGAVCSGLTAVRMAEANHFVDSVFCVFCAAVLDGLDGHVARYMGAVTEIGAELDSLCDLVNFGVAPALVMFMWFRSLPKEACALSRECSFEENLMWVACCVYLSCCAFRLARFNVAGRAAEMDRELPEKSPRTSESPPPPPASAVVRYYHAVRENIMHRKLWFEGVPAPVGASYALSPLMWSLSGLPLPSPASGRIGAISILLLTGVLMVSRVPTLSSKMLKTSQKSSHLRSSSIVTSLSKFLAAVFAFFFSWRYAPAVFLLLAALHAASIPFGVMLYRDIGHERTA